jgi:Flp pilus assembly pilin Flp
MRKAQSTIEYIVIIGAFAAAVIAAGVYINRGFQGQVRGLADQMGEQYAPGQMTSSISETTNLSSSETTVSSSSEGILTSQSSDTTETQTVTRQSSERVGALSAE